MSKEIKEYKQTVFCKLQIDGTHYWALCPIKEVNFLKENHRHMFNIKAFKKVNHDDRDIEFIWLKHEITEYLRNKYYDESVRTHAFGGMSCEMLATELIVQFDLCKCEVNEDNENGAIVEV